MARRAHSIYGRSVKDFAKDASDAAILVAIIAIVTSVATTNAEMTPFKDARKRLDSHGCKAQ